MPGENRTIARRWVVLLALAGMASVAHAQPAARPVSVRFELNDAQVKGRALEGVAVTVSQAGGGGALSSGRTGADGRWTTPLPPGAYQVSYRLEGYVPYTSEATEVREDGQLVTVSLSRMLEATESGGREVRIILNWGSRPDQVRDADSHLACPCGAGTGHVYYQNRTHEAADHKVELDVDDTDWGGPETITLTRPVPGTYIYWVHDFSGPPATLGGSDAVVRVVVGSQEAGEFRVFKGVTRRAWRPFKAIEVSREGVPTLVRFTEDEIAEAADLVVPAELQPPDAAPEAPSPPSAEPATPSRFPIPIFYLLVFFVFVLIARARRRRRRRE
jgi:hypothetical protein